jgi:hypothetical protein
MVPSKTVALVAKGLLTVSQVFADTVVSLETLDTLAKCQNWAS